MRTKTSSGGEFGAGIDNAGHDQSHHQVPLSSAAGVDEPGQAQAVETPQRGVDMTVR